MTLFTKKSLGGGLGGNPIRSNSSIMLLKIDAEFADSISIKLTHSSTTALLYTSTYLTPKARSVLGL